MKIFVVADPETSLAFALAGIKSHAVQSETEAPTVLAALAREEEVGLILITEQLARENRQIIDKMLIEPGGPLILQIPSTGGPIQKRERTIERIAALLRR
jgi:vacuolar-type H+-ATPase subunit F/Vma7